MSDLASFATVDDENKPKKLGRRSMSRMLTVRDEITHTTIACELAAKQLKDDLVIGEVERALEAISETVENFGNLWLAGDGPGFCVAVDVVYKLSTIVSNYECPTRACVLGLNGAISSTSYGKDGAHDALAAELEVHARAGDVFWCFASDSGSRSLLNAAKYARQKLDLPVVVFTNHPGTPLIKFATHKVRIHSAEDEDQANYCVNWAHSFLANIMCNQLKRAARKSRRKNA